MAVFVTGMVRRLLLMIALGMNGVVLTATAQPPASQLSGAQLIDAPGQHLVRGHCSACHSLTLVTAQRGDRDFWLKTIRWMQAEQNLWQLPVEHEEAILAYLAEHYNEVEWGRRPALPVHLRPR